MNAYNYETENSINDPEYIERGTMRKSSCIVVEVVSLRTAMVSLQF